MTVKTDVLNLLLAMLKMDAPVETEVAVKAEVVQESGRQEALDLPVFSETDLLPVRQADGRLTLNGSPTDTAS